MNSELLCRVCQNVKKGRCNDSKLNNLWIFCITWIGHVTSDSINKVHSSARHRPHHTCLLFRYNNHHANQQYWWPFTLIIAQSSAGRWELWWWQGVREEWALMVLGCQGGVVSSDGARVLGRSSELWWCQGVRRSELWWCQGVREEWVLMVPGVEEEWALMVTGCWGGVSSDGAMVSGRSELWWCQGVREEWALMVPGCWRGVSSDGARVLGSSELLNVKNYSWKTKMYEGKGGEEITRALVGN